MHPVREAPDQGHWPQAPLRDMLEGAGCRQGGAGASEGQHEGGIRGTGASCPMAALQARLFALVTLTVSNTQMHGETKC